MKCEETRKLLSAFVDEALETAEQRAVSGHLEGCAKCRLELGRLEKLRRMLVTLDSIQPPDYLRHMLQLRMETARQLSWGVRIQSALEYRWSRIRTTGGMWYATRLLGSTAALLLFLAITVAMRPVYIEVPRGNSEDSGTLSSLRQQLLVGHVLKDLGLLSPEEQMRPVCTREPEINDLYLLRFGQDASRTRGEDSFSVLARVDRSGAASIEGVLEYPYDQTLLSDFSNMIQSARCRPASYNGKAVSSHMVLAFSRIEVSD